MDDLDKKRAYQLLVAAFLVVVVGGTVFYHFVEKLSWVDAYYFCVVTLATVGYGDITPHTTAGKLFTTLYIFMGVGIVTAFITTTLKRRAVKLHDRHEVKNGHHEQN